MQTPIVVWRKGLVNVGNLRNSAVYKTIVAMVDESFETKHVSFVQSKEKSSPELVIVGTQNKPSHKFCMNFYVFELEQAWRHNDLAANLVGVAPYQGKLYVVCADDPTPAQSQ